MTLVAPVPVRGPRRQLPWTSAAISLVAVAGMVVLLYPSMSAWFSARAQQSSLDAWTEQVRAGPPAAMAELWAQARAYNDAIPEILLTDPYTIDDALAGRGGAYDLYDRTLVVPGTEVMARIRIPDVGIDLPVFHGTDERTLELGAGHLFGASLPVGGPGSHSVVTAHNGRVEATMFDDLDRVEVGDTVLIDVLDRTLVYRVTGSRTVLPTEVSSLALAPGRDLLTLITCTPTGVNSHRLLVHAERVEDPVQGADGPTRIARAGSGPGFPWWAVQFVGGSVLAVWAVFRLTRPRPVTV